MFIKSKEAYLVVTTIKALVQYESRPIRRLIFKCPKCGKWFNTLDVTDTEIGYDYELDIYVGDVMSKNDYDSFICPSCNYNPCTDNDAVKISVQEVEEFPEVAKKRTIWE